MFASGQLRFLGLSTEGRRAPGAQQAAANALGKACAELLGQRLRSGFHQHDAVWVGFLNSAVLSSQATQFDNLSLKLYFWCTGFSAISTIKSGP